MEWQQLEYFRVVAKTEHFRKAAEKLNISQPALSRSITNLEAELGISLFDRVGRAVKLNKFGKVFLRRVENGLKEISDGVQEINQLKNPFTGTVSIAFLQTFGVSILPEIIRNFNERFPYVEIQLYQNNIFSSIQQILNREVDFCLITAVRDHPEITWHSLFDEELFLYVPANHRLAGSTSVSLSEIAGEPFIAFKKELAMREVINSFFEKTGFTPVIKFEGEDVSSMAGLVSAGLGVTIIPPFEGISGDKIKKIAISEPYCYREIGLAWIKENTLTPSGELFQKFVIERYKK